MQETVKKPYPPTEQCSTLGELFQACLELASLRAEHLLAADRLREQHQRIARELVPGRRLETSSGIESPETQSKDVCDRIEGA